MSKWIMAVLLFLTGSLFTGVSVFAAEGNLFQICEVHFWDESGTEEYVQLRDTVLEGKNVVLPEVPQLEDAVALGWRTDADGNSEDIWEAGSEYTVEQDVDFYAVYQSTEECSVQFIDPYGTAPEPIVVKKGTEVTLELPSEVEGYRSLGWSADENAKEASYLPETSYVITEDITLYPVRSKLYQLTFLTNTGKTTARLQALAMTGIAGETVTLPNLPVYDGYQSLGWTTELRGTTVTHKEGSTYTIVGDQTFYQINRKIYTVTFFSKNGRKEYTSLEQSVLANSYLELPALPKVEGYKALGWATEKGASTSKYKAGSSVCIKRNVQFYGVYQKLPSYTVRFYTYAGGYEYKSLSMQVYSGTTITLPNLPSRLNYAAVGWGKVKSPKSADTVKEGTKVKVTANMKFYGCWKNAKTLQFMWNGGGGEYTSLRMNVTGTTAVLPTLASPSGYTFLGWSDKPNQTSNPKYQMGRKITVTQGMKLYSVVMKKPMADIPDEEITASSRYDTVFFIGDSRTVAMKKAVSGALGDDGTKVQFICKNGQSLDWFEENETEFLMKIKSTRGKKAVVFNLGINSLVYNTQSGYVASQADRYAASMNRIAQTLQQYNCSMYFMSVNPANEKECVSEAYGGVVWKERYPKWIQDFNYLVRTQLEGYTYIDTYNYLINTGFELTDGLHYSTATYRKIYQKAIAIIDAS